MDKALNLLKRVRILQEIMKRRARSVERYETILNSVTRPSDMPRVQGGRRNKAGVFDRLIEERERYAKAADNYFAAHQLVNRVLDEMNDPLYAELLYIKYVEPVEPTWRELGETLHYSTGYTCTLHDKAVRLFSETLAEMTARKNKSEKAENGEDAEIKKE